MTSRSKKSLAPKCRICGDSPTIKSHLIPQGFVKEIFFHPKGDEKHMLVSNDKGFKTSSTTGRYETDLLCAKCDGKLGAYEERALVLLRELRQIPIGTREGSKSVIEEGTYPFRVRLVDDFIRFACGILWKYMSVPDDSPSKIMIEAFRVPLEKVCFQGAPVPTDIDVFLERDLFAATAYDDPHDVFYYTTPSLNERGGRTMAWFSVGGFVIYVQLDSNGASHFAPPKCWMRGRKKCYFNVDLRALHTNIGIIQSMDEARDHLARLNRKVVIPPRYSK
ncbi:hypothetical protein JS562_17130 [Agrobacterium sp. S2]|nr:hypothetical protein [Agrobacterium sp. S2]